MINKIGTMLARDEEEYFQTEQEAEKAGISIHQTGRRVDVVRMEVDS